MSAPPNAVTITISHDPEWRRSVWDASVRSRPAWFVTCPVHADLGRDQSGEPWGYARPGTARMVARRHANGSRHAGQLVTVTHGEPPADRNGAV